MFSICAYISSKTLVVRINSHSKGAIMFNKIFESIAQFSKSASETMSALTNSVSTLTNIVEAQDKRIRELEENVRALDEAITSVRDKANENL